MVHRQTGVRYRVIELTVEGETSDEARSVFRARRDRLHKLDHPHIPRPLAMDDAFVLPEPRGELLSELLGKREFTPWQIHQIALQIASALEHAHARVGPHGLLWLESIRVCSETFIQVEGFEQSFEFPKAEDRAILGEVMEPYRLTPERIQGLRDTPQSDVYGLGEILFALFTGRHP
jgi:hypothetical protein